jgi:uncharacterized protein
MLLRFEVSNHRSILDPVELSMVAVDEDRRATRKFDLLSERVLAIAGIYGPNASGKSNALEALTWLSVAVQQSLRAWDKIIPREPFKFGRGPDESSFYEVEMVVGGVRHVYHVELDDSTVLFESLFSYPERRKRILFERDGLEINFRRGLGFLAGTRDLLTPSTLALSAAMRLEDSEIQRFGRHLAGIQVLGPRRATAWNRYGVVGDRGLSTMRLFDRDHPQLALFDEGEFSVLPSRKSALALLKFADLGIDEVHVVETDDNDARISPQVRRQSRRRAQLMHRVANQELPFELSEESTGTRTWFSLIGPTLSALNSGRVVLIDELDASLHPRLSARLLELFQDPDTNPNGAQLIFTSHDTSLLNFLNRDEVWLTEKGDNGATTLTALAEYGGDKVRRSLNLERAYLQGRFGAVPELDQFMLRRALGMTPKENHDTQN